MLLLCTHVFSRVWFFLFSQCVNIAVVFFSLLNTSACAFLNSPLATIALREKELRKHKLLRLTSAWPPSLSGRKACQRTTIVSWQPVGPSSSNKRPENPARRLEMEHLTPGPPKATRPAPTVFCYICGRQFGSKSIEIHIPNCIVKFEREQAKLPKSQRRPLPQKPDIVKTEDGKVDVEKTNEAAWQTAQEALVQCKFCNRSFNPDRLAIHNRSCTKENPAKKVPKKV